MFHAVSNINIQSSNGTIIKCDVASQINQTRDRKRTRTGLKVLNIIHSFSYINITLQSKQINQPTSFQRKNQKQYQDTANEIDEILNIYQ